MANTGVFLNFVSEKMIHAKKGEKGDFYSVSIATDKSESGYGTLSVTPKMIFAATKKDGTVIEGVKNVLLGDPDKTRKVSVKKGDGYESIELTNAEIKAGYDAERESYRKAHAAAAE